MNNKKYSGENPDGNIKDFMANRLKEYKTVKLSGDFPLMEIIKITGTKDPDLSFPLEGEVREDIIEILCLCSNIEYSGLKVSYFDHSINKYDPVVVVSHYSEGKLRVSLGTDIINTEVLAAIQSHSSVFSVILEFMKRMEAGKESREIEERERKEHRRIMCSAPVLELQQQHERDVKKIEQSHIAVCEKLRDDLSAILRGDGYVQLYSED